jgi:hypothetical protein
MQRIELSLMSAVSDLADAVLRCSGTNEALSMRRPAGTLSPELHRGVSSAETGVGMHTFPAAIDQARHGA